MEKQKKTILNHVKMLLQKFQSVQTKHLNIVYYIAFACVLIQQYIFLTRFPREPFEIFYIVGTFIASGVAGFRWIQYVGRDHVYCVASVVIVLVGGVYLFIRGSFYFLVLALLTVGAKDVRSRDLLIIYCVIAAMMISANIVSFMVTGGKLDFRGNSHFGSINSTDFQGLLFFLLIPYLMLRREKITYVEIIVWIGIVVFFWLFTSAENNLYCSLIALAYVIGHRIFLKKAKNVIGVAHSKDYVLNNWLSYMCVAAFIICGTIMIFLVARYKPENSLWITLNNILHKRLRTAHEVYQRYPPNLFGSDYVVVGWGYTPGVDTMAMNHEYGYTYIDSSYPNILIMHGVIIYAIIIYSLTYISYQYKRRKNTLVVFLLAVVALDCCAEGHLKDFACNPFLVFAFTNLLANCNESSEIHIGYQKMRNG